MMILTTTEMLLFNDNRDNRDNKLNTTSVEPAAASKRPACCGAQVVRVVYVVFKKNIVVFKKEKLSCL